MVIIQIHAGLVILSYNLFHKKTLIVTIKLAYLNYLLGFRCEGNNLTLSLFSVCVC